MSNSEEKEPSLLNIYQRMRAVMRDVRGVAKDQFNTHGRYKYAGHEAVTASLRDAYTRHGVVRTADVIEQSREGGMLRLSVRVTWTNVDAPDEQVSVVMVGESPPVTNSGAPSAVQSGIALSYAVKNAEFKAFSLTGDDTPDAEAGDTDRGEPRRGARQATAASEGISETSVKALVDMFRGAQNLDQLKQARAAVRKALQRLSPEQKELLGKERDAAQQRIQGGSANG